MTPVETRGVDLDRLQRVLRRARRGRDRSSADRRADRRRPVEPHVRASPTASTSGSCAARRSGTCSPPRTTWAASTACSPRSRDTDVPVPATLRAVRGPRGQRRAVLRDGAGRRAASCASADDLSKLSDEEAAACSRELVDVLARIHAVDYEAVGLGDFGRPDGFLERQVRRWGEQWERSKTERAARDRRAGAPAARRASRVGPAGDRARRLPARQHDAGADRPGRRSSPCSTGRCRRSATRSPTSGLFLLYWGQRRRADDRHRRGDRRRARASSPRTSSSSATPRSSGREVDHLDFYVVFAFYKLAIIVEGIHARYRMGKTLGRGLRAHGRHGERARRRGHRRRRRQPRRRPSLEPPRPAAVYTWRLM